MRIHFTGGEPAADEPIVQALQAAGHEFTDSSADAVVVHWSHRAAGVRAALPILKPDGHLLLLSTHAVYPSIRSPRPWTVEDFHPADDIGEGATPAARTAREAEREVVLGEGRRTRWTILRPSIVDGPKDPTDRTWWLLSRVLDGGPVVLPDDGPNLYRHLYADDLASALRLLVGDERAFGRVVNVTGEGLLTPVGHALMLMDGLGRRVPVQWVPAASWRAAGLPQPMGEAESTSLIEASPLLTELGWTPLPEVNRVESLARTLSERKAPKPDEHQRATERRVYREALASRDFDVTPGRHTPTDPLPRRWHLSVSPGAPNSLTFHPTGATLPAPVLKVVGLAFDDTVQRLLSGDLPARPEPLVPGHAALLEVVEPGATKLTQGARVLPIARMPCESPECAWCKDGVERFMGVDADGFAASHVTAPVSHLVPVPAGLDDTALLAPSLARLLETFEPLLKESRGPVWILGTTSEAALAGFLVHDAGSKLVHVDRAPPEACVSPEGVAVRSLAAAWEEVRAGVLPRAGLCANLSGAREGENLLVESAESLVTPFGVGLGTARVVKLAAAARRRSSLEDALARLARWRSFRDLEALLGPRVDPRIALDALLVPTFQLGIVGAPA